MISKVDYPRHPDPAIDHLLGRPQVPVLSPQPQPGHDPSQRLGGGVGHLLPAAAAEDVLYGGDGGSGSGGVPGGAPGTLLEAGQPGHGH